MFSKDSVIKCLETNKKASFLDLARLLNVNQKDNREFSNFLNELKNKNIISYSKRYDSYFIPKFLGSYNLEFIVNTKGMSFCIFPLEENVEKRALIFKNSFSVLKGDIVNVNIYKDIDEGFYFATINSLVERKNKYIYAQVDKNLNITPIYFNQQNIIFNYDKTNLIPNSYVKFKIDNVKKDVVFLTLDKLISSISQPYSDIELIVDYSEVKKDFPEEVINEAQKIPDEVINEKDFDRVDLTKEMVVTIDGEKTKDFDDAISVKKISNGNYILGVHIADVAYYVQENSLLDIEAKERGTSIYLINKVIPMLPEKLSNGICSLNPDVKRFTLTLEAEIDKLGNIIKHKIFPSLIKSKYRLTYNQVANMNNDVLIKSDINLYQMLENAYELSNILSNVKKEQGYIDFEIEEPIIELDNLTGKAIGIKNRQRLSSEILIENFMVFANELVSETIAKLNIPSIYRIHDAPDAEKIESLKSFVKVLGINNVNIKNSTDPKMFQNTVNQLKQKRFDSLIKMALLKTMQKAKYSSNNIGHFGLASKYYSHFTSPIRRYPDLLLHRIIWEVIIKGNKKYSIEKENQIESIAKHSSFCEVKATELERKVNDIKKAEFYESKIGLVQEATIVSFHKFGIFIEFDDMTNSLVHISTIAAFNDYKISDDLCKLILKDKTYTIGQRVKAKIISTSKLEGKIDAVIV